MDSGCVEHLSSFCVHFHVAEVKDEISNLAIELVIMSFIAFDSIDLTLL